MKKIFLLLPLLLAGALQAQDRLKPSDAGSPPRISTQSIRDLPAKISRPIEKFFVTLQNGDTKLAFLGLFENSRLSKEGDVVQDYVNTAENSFAKFGRIDSFELVDVRPYGGRMLLATYITLIKDKFFQWQFLYMSPAGTDWVLINLRVDDWREFLPLNPVTLAPPKDVQLKIEKFYLTIQSNRTEDAFNEMLKGSPLENSADPIKAFAAKVNDALKSYGSMRGYELYDNRPLGSKIHLLTYISYLDSKPLRWQFIYRSEKGGPWNLQTVRVDDQLDPAIVQDQN